MPQSRQVSVLRELQSLFRVGTHAGLTDGELLARFINREGEAAELAFATLVERHGPMVFRVCRRILIDRHTTEDAFQATFLILVRKAGSLRDRGSVGNWLYGVAGRVAAKARTLAARRHHHEGRYAQGRPELCEENHDAQAELGAILHEEVSRLPERFRTPIVLCYLEGMTQEQAAARLGWPIGTVRSRLARARERLRSRLIRRGLGPSAPGLVATLTTEVSAAPQALMEATVRSAMSTAVLRATGAGAVPATVDALTEGVLKTMLMTKLKIAAMVLVTLATAATGAGVLATQDDPNDPAPPNTATKPEEPKSPPKTGARTTRIGEYLERTTREVDAAVADLEAEVKDLRARLAQAEANLRRMQSVKAALQGGSEPGYEKAMSPMGMMMGGMMGSPGGPPAMGMMPGMPGPMGTGQPGNAPVGKGTSGYGRPKGVDKRSVDSRRKIELPNEGESAAERRRALDLQIEQLIRQRDELPMLDGEKKGPPVR